jgi:acetyl-CoA C-acetyltransferase
MFDIAPIADGAAAIILTRPELLPPGAAHPLIRIAGSSLVTDTLALHDRPDPLVFHAARLSVERACQQARVTPIQIDFFELDDSFSIYALLSLEAAGYAERGEGWRLAQDNCLGLGGSLPICTMGGSKARGNPGGAVGVYQAVEAVIQLRGLAGDNQVKDARRAMIQCLGGPSSTAATHILETIA